MKRLIKKNQQQEKTFLDIQENTNPLLIFNQIEKIIKQAFSLTPKTRTNDGLTYEIGNSATIIFQLNNKDPEDGPFMIRLVENNKVIDTEYFFEKEIFEKPDLIIQHFTRFKKYYLQRSKEKEIDSSTVEIIYNEIQGIYKHSRLCQRDNSPYSKEEVANMIRVFGQVSWWGHVSEGYLGRTFESINVDKDIPLLFAYGFIFYPEGITDFRVVDDHTHLTIFTARLNMIKGVSDWIRTNRNAILFSILKARTNEKTY